MLVAPPEAAPRRRRGGESGTGAAAGAVTSARETAEDLQLALVRRLRPRDALEDELTEALHRRVAAAEAVLGDERRREDDAVRDDGREEQLDVFGRHEVSAVDQRPRSRGSLERQPRADGGPQSDLFERARCGDE